MAFVPIDINQIKLDKPDYSDPAVVKATMLDLYPDDRENPPQPAQATGNFVPIDITKIKLDAPPQQQPENNALESAISGVAQGASYNFGDEIMAGLTAPVMYAGSKILDSAGVDTKGLSDRTLGEIYHGQQQRNSEQNQAAREDNPLAYGAGEIAGIIGTGVAGAGTKAGQAVAGSISRGLLPNATTSGGRLVNLTSKIGQAAAVGGASSGLAGFGGGEDGNRTEAARDAAVIGGAVGGAFVPIAGAVGAIKNALLPKVTDLEVSRLAKIASEENIPLLRSQIGDSEFAKTLSSTTKSIPLTGGKDFAGKQMTAFNKAVLSKAGIKADKATPEILHEAETNFTKRFDDLTGKTGIAVDNQLLNEFAAIEAEATRRLGNNASITVKSYVDDILSNNGVIDGKTYQNTRSQLGKLAQSTGDSFLANIYKSMQSSLDDAAFKSLPEASRKEWQEVRKQYSAFKTIQRAMTNSGEDAAIGNIRPAQLAIAAKSGNSRYAVGAGELNDLARIGTALIKDSIPNSGTAQRLLALDTLINTGKAATLGATGAGVGAYQNPENRIGGAIIGGAGAVALAKGFNKINSSQKIVKNALKNKESNLVKNAIQYSTPRLSEKIASEERKPLKIIIRKQKN